MSCRFVFVWLCLNWILAAEPAPAGPPFVDGDVVAMIGDSITHDGRYARYLSDFYVTRFPERTVRFVNCGIAGDTAGGVLKRLASDVLPNQPTAAVVMLGMNDVGRGAYGTAAPAAAQKPEFREKFITGFRSNLGELVAQLRTAGIKRIILVTPTPFDQTAELPNDKLEGVNDALGRCAAITRETAAATGCGLVDFHAPMTALNLARQKDDPKFTLIGQDRVHPGSTGHLIMAWLFLRAQGVPAVVSRIALDTQSKSVTATTNAVVDKLVWQADGCSCEVSAKALPFPINPDAKAALGWVPLMTDLNREELAVATLPAGRYRLTIDQAEIGVFNAQELAAGIDLGGNAKTPQTIQAQGLLMLSNEQYQAAQPLRSIALIDEKWLPSSGLPPVDPADQAAVTQRLTAAVAKAAGAPAWKQRIFDEYQKAKSNLPQIEQRIHDLGVKLHQAAQPRSHHYEVRRVAD
jgi:lysophospholipase L1-like esterase